MQGFGVLLACVLILFATVLNCSVLLFFVVRTIRILRKRRRARIITAPLAVPLPH